MEVIVADSAGFCFGVQRAVDTVYSEVESGNKIYTLGPIIHNEQVVSDLCSKGVTVIDDLNKVAELENGTIIIRSHGISKKDEDMLTVSALKVVDATCPFVKKYTGSWKKAAVKESMWS